MNLLAWLIVGLVAGSLGGRITGREPKGCLTTIAIGIVGALIGGALANAAGLGGIGDFGFRSIAVAALGSVVFLFVLGAIEGRKT